MKHSEDKLSPFIFEYAPIRGGIVQLHQVLQDNLEHQHLPLTLQTALGELMTASALLSSSIKMDGSLIMQLQGRHALKLLVVECDSQLQMRATAKFTDGIENLSFAEMIVDSQFVITLAPDEGEPYQGVISTEGNSVAEILENYMHRSQQIDTRIMLTSDGKQAAGMMIQKLPEQTTQDTDAWNRANHLFNTLTVSELQNLDPVTLLSRIFAEEDIRVFNARPIAFRCQCSRSKVTNMLKMLGKDEVLSMLAEQPLIEVHCDFCNKEYRFDAVDAKLLLQEEVSISLSHTQH